MTRPPHIPFEHLTRGTHVLTGVDFDKAELATYGEQFTIAQCMRFTLDGNTYVAVEDPCDEYRSTLAYLALSDKPCARQFPGVEVQGKEATYRNGNRCGILQFTRVDDGRVVLELGTDNSDDYYPWYVATFHEAALS